MSQIPLLPHHIEAVHTALLNGPKEAALSSLNNPDFKSLAEQGRLSEPMRIVFADYYGIPALQLLLDGQFEQLAPHYVACVVRVTQILARYTTPQPDDDIRFIFNGTDLICSCFPSQQHCSTGDPRVEKAIFYNLQAWLGSDLRDTLIPHHALIKHLSQINFIEMLNIAYPI